MNGRFIIFQLNGHFKLQIFVYNNLDVRAQILHKDTTNLSLYHHPYDIITLISYSLTILPSSAARSHRFELGIQDDTPVRSTTIYFPGPC